MESVFVVQHVHILLPQQEEDYKFIGVYASHDDALAAVSRLVKQPGFRDFPRVVDPSIDDDEQGFHVSEYRIGKDQWEEGFVTVL